MYPVRKDTLSSAARFSKFLLKIVVDSRLVPGVDLKDLQLAFGPSYLVLLPVDAAPLQLSEAYLPEVTLPPAHEDSFAGVDLALFFRSVDEKENCFRCANIPVVASHPSPLVYHVTVVGSIAELPKNDHCAVCVVETTHKHFSLRYPV